MSHFRANWPAHLAALVAGCLLVACADESTGPQFATDPRPTRSPTEAVASPSPALLPTAAAIATPASFTDLLRVRGAVSAVYMASGRDVWSVSSDGEATHLFEAPDGLTIRDLDASPDAQAVGILLETSSDGRVSSEVVLVDAAGSITKRVDVQGTASATPLARDADVRQTIDWSPQADQILVQLETGGGSRFSRRCRWRASQSRLWRRRWQRDCASLVPDRARYRVHLRERRRRGALRAVARHEKRGGLNRGQS